MHALLWADDARRATSNDDSDAGAPSTEAAVAAEAVEAVAEEAEEAEKAEEAAGVSETSGVSEVSGVAEPPRGTPLSQLRVLPGGAGWEEAAATTLREQGVVLLPGLLHERSWAPLLRQVNTWPVDAEGTSWSTRQPHQRRHQALPMTTGASGVVVRELLTALQQVVSRVLGSGPRLVECGFLSSLPGARAQLFHADTAPAHLR